MANQQLFGFRRTTQKTLKTLAGQNEFDVPLIAKPIQLGGCFLYLTPVGGIPAATGTAPALTMGTASCTLCEIWNDSGTIKVRAVSPTVTEAIRNPAKVKIEGSRVIPVGLIDGELTALFLDTTTQLTVITALQVTSTAIQYKSRTIRIIDPGTESAWTDLITTGCP